MGRRIQVAVRLRPGEGGAPCVAVGSECEENVVVTDLSGTHAATISRSFHVDQIIREDCTNEELFRRLVRDRILSSVDEPDTSCFLAYGHTNSGKTHSIVGTAAEPGLLSLSARSVLDVCGVAEVAMLEVYGEHVHDLLARGERRLIRRRSGPTGTVILVEGLTTCMITSMEEWGAVSEFGLQARRTAPTERNARSSRSHAIFTIKSKGLRLCLVDLAGSERQTIYSPQLNKESIAINKSLSRLSTVLEALSKVQLKPNGTASYVNFRDTTLTVLLQRYLCGASMTLFLACIHPDAQFYEETISTMRYTQRLRCIKTKNTPQRPIEDLSLFHLGEKHNLLTELVMLRKIVGEQQQQQQQQEEQQGHHHFTGDVGRVVESVTDKCVEHNGSSDFLPQVGDRISYNGGSRECRCVVERCRQRLLRSKDTMRVAGWLLSRILSQLPELFIGFDDYFDSYLPSQVQVVGYVSLMTCLPPRDVNEAKASLAFLDVGDIAMGLSMLDAGIPACVRLHSLSCSESTSWEAHEYDAVNRVFVLAFFEINEQLVEATGGSPDAFGCCEGFLTLEPLVPLAMVLCTPLNASDELKENILQHLVTLQGEQEGALERTMDNTPPPSPIVDKRQRGETVDSTGRLNTSALQEVMQWRLECTKESDSSSSSYSLSPAAPLVEEIERQTMNLSKLCLPFQQLPSAHSRDQLGGLPTAFSQRLCTHSFAISSTSSSSCSPRVSSHSLAASHSLVNADVETSSSSLSLTKKVQTEVLSKWNSRGNRLPTFEDDMNTEDEGRGIPVSVDTRENNELDKSGGFVSLANVPVDACGKKISPLAVDHSLLPPAREVTKTPVDSPKKEEENSAQVPARRSAATCGHSEHAGGTRKKGEKNKHKLHRKREPVLEVCNACSVL